LITHDLGVVAEIAERVMVMYAATSRGGAGGRAFPVAASSLYARPAWRGAQARSSLTGSARRLAEIPGQVPSLKQRIDGCAFAGRCPLATDLCREVAPGLEEKGPRHIAACHYAAKAAAAA